MAAPERACRDDGPHHTGHPLLLLTEPRPCLPSAGASCPQAPKGPTSGDASSPLVAIFIVVSLQPTQVGGGARRTLGTREVTCPRAAPTPALRSTGPNSPIPILKSFTISEEGACSFHTGPRIKLLGSQGFGISCLCFIETRHFLKERCQSEGSDTPPCTGAHPPALQGQLYLEVSHKVTREHKCFDV